MAKNTVTIATFAGIPVKIHWTFGLLLLGMGYMEYAENQSMRGLAYIFAYICLLFACVVLHEYGHALTARRYGVKTLDIILSPIGGLARLYEIPEEPRKEFMIAIAGPLVNVAIATILFILFVISGIDLLPNVSSIAELYTPVGLLQLLFVMNIALFLFNLIPAFPMDGGRILRAILSTKFSRKRATFFAMIVGRIMAALLLAYAIFTVQPIMGFIALFVYSAAGEEYRSIVLKESLTTTKASQIMRRDFTEIALDAKYADVIIQSRLTAEYNFLVIDEDETVVGAIPYPYLLDVVKNKSAEYVQQLYENKVHYYSEDTTVDAIYDAMQRDDISIIPIGIPHAVEGVIDRHILQTFIKSKEQVSPLRKLLNFRNQA